jgi:hypothetical protein
VDPAVPPLLAIAFTVTVIATFIALARRSPWSGVSYVPLLPLALLVLSGLYLLVRPDTPSGYAVAVAPNRSER